MKKVYILGLALLFSLPVKAQDTIGNWVLGGFGALNFNQLSLTNWAAGGDNSIGLGSLVNFNTVFKKGKHAWMNNLDLAYGFQFQGKGHTSKFVKTDDKIDFTTSYGYRIGKHWDLTVLANFKSQFAPGYNYPNDSTLISRFMAPGYLVVGLGFSYIPAPYFSLYLSPASVRMTFVLDDTLSKQGAFGVDKGKKLKKELGPYVKALFIKDVFRNVNINTSLELYTDYFKNFGNIDVNWNFLLTLKATRWLAATLNLQLIYDDDVIIKDEDGNPLGPRTQFKENLSIGLSYKIHKKGAAK